MGAYRKKIVEWVGELAPIGITALSVWAAVNFSCLGKYDNPSKKNTEEIIDYARNTDIQTLITPGEFGNWEDTRHYFLSEKGRRWKEENFLSLANCLAVKIGYDERGRGSLSLEETVKEDCRNIPRVNQCRRKPFLGIVLFESCDEVANGYD